MTRVDEIYRRPRPHRITVEEWAALGLSERLRIRRRYARSFLDPTRYILPSYGAMPWEWGLVPPPLLPRTSRRRRR